MQAADVADPAGVAVGDQPQPLRRRAARSSSTVPWATTWPRGEHDQVVAQPLDQVELVAGEQHRDAAGGLLAQQVDHRVDRARVEAGERLVEDQCLGAVHQRGDDLDPLLVAEAELLDPVAGAVGEPEPLEVLAGRRAGVRRRSCPESSPR